MDTAAENRSAESEVLGLAFDYLTNRIDSTSVLPVALSVHLITDSQKNEYDSVADSFKRAVKFIGHLQSAVNDDSNKYHTFIRVLKETGQSSIASRLDDEFTKASGLMLASPRNMLFGVPDKLLEELRVDYASLMYEYKKVLESSPEAQKKFVELLPGLVGRSLGPDHSFQSYFNKLVDEEVSLFNVTYLQNLCCMFPANVYTATEKLVDHYKQQCQVLMSNKTVDQFKTLFPASATPSKLLTEKFSVELKFLSIWGEHTLNDLKDLVGLFGVPGKHLHLSNVHKGCIAVIWLCSTLFIKELKAAIVEATDSLQTKGVLKVFVEEELILECPTMMAVAEEGKGLTEKVCISSRTEVWPIIERYKPSLTSHFSKKPNINPEMLRDFILSDEIFVSAKVALIMVAGLPFCGKSELMLKMLQRQFQMGEEDVKKIAEITETGNEFSFLELGAVKDEESATWQWYPFTKRSGYLSCFVSALESDKKQEIGRRFQYQPHKQYMFGNEALDDCFYTLYQLLSAFYNELQGQPDSAILEDKLVGGATLNLFNVWDIGFNRAILHFLTLLGGYFHHNFPILFLKYPDDVDNLTEHVDISHNEKLKGLEPILHQYSRAKFLLSFSHLARSSKNKRKAVCKIAAIVDSREELLGEDPELAKHISDKISQEAKKLNAMDLLHSEPTIVDQKDQDDLKKEVDSLITNETQDKVPLSWFFFRSAFFKTGQLYIKTRKLEKYARKCGITDERFKEFLSKFTGIGSIIHIPGIPRLRDYVILNPPDFFHKLNELFYPRFNGDLQCGIASNSTLRRLFGEDLQFFRDVLTSCSFAVEIDSDRIVYGDNQRRLPIAEKCLYIPGMRTGTANQEESEPLADSLLLVYEKALLPTHTTENVVRFLVKKKPNFRLLTCKCYTITRFVYCSQPVQAMSPSPNAEEPPSLPSITMISHGDKNEIRIENDREETNAIKEAVIQAYCSANEIYSKQHFNLLGVRPMLKFALACPTDRNNYHFFATSSQPCESCQGNETFMSTWTMWEGIIKEVIQNQDNVV